MRGARLVAAGMAVGLLVAGCTSSSGSGSSGAGPGAGSGAASDNPAMSRAATAYVLPACPSLPHQRVVAGGLPDLRLPCLGDGPAVSLADLRGTPTVLEVWAAWCTICAEEMPIVARGVAKAGDRVRFFGVHYKAPAAYGRQSAADFGVPYPSVQDADGDKTVLALKATAPPQMFFVDAAGRVRGHLVGAVRSDAELADLVTRYLGVTL